MLWFPGSGYLPKCTVMAWVEDMMEHPGQPWGNSRSPPVPWPHVAQCQPALWAFCRDDFSSSNPHLTSSHPIPSHPPTHPPHPHACFIPFYTTSLTGLHIWIFLTSALIQTAQGLFLHQKSCSDLRLDVRGSDRSLDCCGIRSDPTRCGCWCGKRKWTRLDFRSKNWKKWRIALPVSWPEFHLTIMSMHHFQPSWLSCMFWSWLWFCPRLCGMDARWSWFLQESNRTCCGLFVLCVIWCDPFGHVRITRISV